MGNSFWKILQNINNKNILTLYVKDDAKDPKLTSSRLETFSAITLAIKSVKSLPVAIVDTLGELNFFNA